MRTGFICILVAMLNRRLLPVQASEVSLKAEPSSIKDGLTKTLQMRCSFQARNNKVQSTGERRALTVHSITITRDDKTTIASISAILPAVASADVDTLTASGHLDPSDESSFLQLTWTKPRISQSGIYKCEINTTDNAGQNVLYKSNISVCNKRPNEKDIIEYIIELEERLSQTQLAVQSCERNLKTELNDVRAASNNAQSNLQGQIDNLRTVGVSNSATLQRLETGATSLSTNVTAIQNTLGSYVVEQGSIRFGHTDTYQSNEDGTSKKLTVNVKFTKNFSKVPTVICSLMSLDGAKETNTRLYYYISDVSATGFNLHFQTWGNTIFYGSDVQWTASIP